MIDACRRADTAHQSDRRIANTNHTGAQFAPHRLSNDSGRIRKVDDPRIGSHLAHCTSQFHRDGQCTERIGIATHPDRFLSEDSFGQRNTLVSDTSGCAAHSYG